MATIPSTNWTDDGSPDITWYKPKSSDPASEDFKISTQREYDITNAAQLVGLAVLCNEHGVRFNKLDGVSGSTKIVINIKNDIDLSAHRWIPIGKSGTIQGNTERLFSGIFNGHGKTISGVIVEESTQQVGFFGKTGDGALLTNIVLDNVSIECTHSGGDFSSQTGGIVGNGQYTYDAGTATEIENCIVKSGDIRGPYAGGIAGGNNSGSIKHCVNNAEVVGSRYAGGIAPYVSYGVTITHCVNTGTIRKSSSSVQDTIHVGGIVGFYGKGFNEVLSTIKYCANTGTSDGGALVGLLGDSTYGFNPDLSANYWLTSNNTKAVDGTKQPEEGKTPVGIALLSDMPAVAALFDETPYGFHSPGNTYTSYYEGSSFDIKLTLYPIGANNSASAKISAGTVVTEQAISSLPDSAKTTITVAATGNAEMIIKSGAADNLVTQLRGNADWNNNRPSPWIYGTVAPTPPGPTPPEPEPEPEKPVIDSTVIIPDSIDVTKMPEEFSNVNVAAEALSSDITAADLTVKGGVVVLRETAAMEALKAEAPEKIQPLPLFTIATSKDIAASAWKVKGVELLADTFDKVDVRKIISSTESLKFTYKADAADFTDGTFTILDMSGKPASGAVDAEAEYQLLLFIADNGDYDLNKTTGTVADPAVIVKTQEKPTPTPTPSSGGGGCSAGFGALALLALLPSVIRGKREKR